MSVRKSTITNENILNQVTGFREALVKKQELEQSGTDFRDQRGQVRRTVEGIHPKRLKLRVVGITTDTPSTKTLRLAATDGRRLPPFQAGQYINLFTTVQGVATARPYAISSSPENLEYYDLTVKKLTGGFVSIYLVDEVEVGQLFESTGPMGTFHYNPLFHGDELVFLAGGSGIAPAISMLRIVLALKQPLRFHFVYNNSFEDDVIFAAELRELAAKHENFALTELVSRPTADFTGRRGHLSLELLRNVLPDPESRMYYICGPTPFNEHCVRLLGELNVKSRRVLVEGNGPPRNPDQLPGWPSDVSVKDTVKVSVRGRGEFQAQVGEPLLNSLERNGYATENACRSGECSLCRVKLRSGNVYNPPEALIRKSDKRFGWVHSCVAFPVTDVEIQL
ncbi:MAG: FAD-binding oxidoreductase [Leptospirales bacterium]|jgi:ferredoxin-NADP reductase